LVRLTFRALDLVFALLLVFAAALAFDADFFFLATMRAPFCSERQPPMSRADADDQTSNKVDGGAVTGDRNTPAKIVSYTERLRNAMAPAPVRVGEGRPPLTIARLALYAAPRLQPDLVWSKHWRYR
jgi:hypothetical protein